MKLKNSGKDYGLVSIALHWLVALTVIGLFLLGDYMMGLTYYDDLYRTAPFVHKSIGILLLIVMVGRVVWRKLSPPPQPEESLTPVEKKSAHLVHVVLYVMIFVIIASGYLISTADGRAISVFGWFDVPALGVSIPNQADLAGEVHEILALTLMCIVGLHAAAAIKHHVIDKDHTLKKMFGIQRK